jgi:hypothetical protein
MTPLHQLQELILGAVLGADRDATASLDAMSLIDSAGPRAIDRLAAAQGAAVPVSSITPAARLRVYRNTVRSNFAAALESTFPAVRRLVGEAYFRRVARDFAVRHPSRSGDLRHVGAPFPGYLAEVHGQDQYRYLGEVARLELLIEEVLLAPEHPRLDLTVLAAVAPSAYENLRFVLNPALRLFESPYPIKKIWESNVLSDAEPGSIDLESGAERFAVLRRRLQLQFHPLSPGEWRWLAALSEHLPFAASLEAAAAAEGDFDATAALQRFVELGAIVGFL